MRSDIDGSSGEADMSGSELVNPSRGGLEASKPRRKWWRIISKGDGEILGVFADNLSKAVGT